MTNQSTTEAKLHFIPQRKYTLGKSLERISKLLFSFGYLKLKYIFPTIICILISLEVKWYNHMKTNGSIKQMSGNVQAYLIH